MATGTRRTSLRIRKRAAPPQVPQDEPEIEEVTPTQTVRRQLQAKVSGSLMNRGVNTSDRWQAKPPGQLTAQDELRLERQRANKRRWARKERERSRQELETLRKRKGILTLQNDELRDQVKKLRKCEYRLRSLLADHECKRPVVRVVVIPASRRRRCNFSSHEEESCRPSSTHLVSTLERTSTSTGGKGKRLCQTKVPTCRRVARVAPISSISHSEGFTHQSTGSFPQSRASTSQTTHSAPRPHDPTSIDAILMSALEVSASVTLNPLNTAANGKQTEIISSTNVQTTADEVDIMGQDQISPTADQRHELGTDGSITGPLLQIDGLFTADMTDDIPESFLDLLLQDDGLTSDVIQSWSGMGVERNFEGTDVENLLPMASEDNIHDNVSYRHQRTDGNWADVSHTDTGSETLTDIQTTGVGLNDAWLDTRQTQQNSQVSQDSETITVHLPLNLETEISNTVADQLSTSTCRSSRSTSSNGISNATVTTDTGSSCDPPVHFTVSVASTSSTFLPDQMPLAPQAARNHNQTISSDFLLSGTPPSETIDISENEFITLQMKTGTKADRISGGAVTSKGRSAVYKRSLSLHDNCFKIENLSKRGRRLTLPTSETTFPDPDNTPHGTTTMARHTKNMHCSSQFVVEEGKDICLEIPVHSPNGLRLTNLANRGGSATTAIILVAPELIPSSPSTSPSPDPRSPFRALDTAVYTEVGGFSDDLMMEPTDQETVYTSLTDIGTPCST